jgi:Dynein heavy chain region D6 P-loop domain
MGQGQEPHALQLLNQAISNSEWILLLNCHLSLDFVAEIPNVIESSGTANRTFRLWLTTEPDVKFPSSLLQVVNIYNYRRGTVTRLSVSANSPIGLYVIRTRWLSCIRIRIKRSRFQLLADESHFPLKTLGKL